MNQEERRNDHRIRFNGEGFFIQDSTLWELKLVDTNRGGVGATSNREFRPGAQGLISARFPDSDDQETLLSEVCWCMRDPRAEDPAFQYRVGFRVLDEQAE